MNIKEFTDQQKKDWYMALYGCYFEHQKENGEVEILDPTTVRTHTKRRDKYYPEVNFLAENIIKIKLP